MISKIFLLSYLGTLSLWDIKEKKVPLLILLGGWAFVLYFLASQPFWEIWNWPEEAFWRLPALFPGCILLLAAKTTKQVGSADGMVLLQAGLLMEYPQCVLLFFVSILLLSAFCVAKFLFCKAHGNSRIPYMPFLLLSYLIL